MIVPLGYVTTFPAARNASICERESGVRIIWRRSSPIVSTQAPQVGSLRILHGRISPLPMWSERIPQSRARRTRAMQRSSPAVNAPRGMQNAEPLGYRLRDLGLLHLNIDYHGGSAWTCLSPSSCRVRDVGKPGRTLSTYSI